MPEFNFTVSEMHDKMRLDKFLSINIPDVSRSKLQQLVENSAVKVNSKVVNNCSYKVEDGDEVEINVEIVTTTSIIPKKMDLKVVFEDKDLIVIDKPIGLTVHPGAGNHNDTLVNALVHHCKGSLSKIGGEARPGIVHRLDRDTSGLMVIAKNDKAHAALSEALKEREIKRTYNAVIYGSLHPQIGTIKTGYGRSKRDRTKMAVMRETERQAITHYKVLKTFANAAFSLVEFSLETGRTHQIRVHMEHKKTPIVGDKTYGKMLNHNLNAYEKAIVEKIKRFPRQALHAVSLSFIHPRTGKQISLNSPLPEDIVELIKLIDV